jgi:hypothetical protein
MALDKEKGKVEKGPSPYTGGQAPLSHREVGERMHKGQVSGLILKSSKAARAKASEPGAKPTMTITVRTITTTVTQHDTQVVTMTNTSTAHDARFRVPPPP